jgi:hypothetical protein
VVADAATATSMFAAPSAGKGNQNHEDSKKPFWISSCFRVSLVAFVVFA